MATLPFDHLLEVIGDLYRNDVAFIVNRNQYSANTLFYFGATEIEQAVVLFPDLFDVSTRKTIKYGASFEFKISGVPDKRKT